jgi:hypothetical protein
MHQRCAVGTTLNTTEIGIPPLSRLIKRLELKKSTCLGTTVRLTSPASKERLPTAPLINPRPREGQQDHAAPAFNRCFWGILCKSFTQANVQVDQCLLSRIVSAESFSHGLSFLSISPHSRDGMPIVDWHVPSRRIRHPSGHIMRRVRVPRVNGRMMAHRLLVSIGWMPFGVDVCFHLRIAAAVRFALMVVAVAPVSVIVLNHDAAPA